MGVVHKGGYGTARHGDGPSAVTGGRGADGGIFHRPDSHPAHARGLALTQISPVAVATYIDEMHGRDRAPTIKQHLAAIRRLFDWLVTGQVMPANPAASVRGPTHVVRTGKTPVLQPAEARLLLDAIDTSTLPGLRDRALLGVMVYVGSPAAATQYYISIEYGRPELVFDGASLAPTTCRYVPGERAATGAGASGACELTDAFGVSCDLSIHCLLGPDRAHSPRHRHSGAELVLCQHR